MDVLRVYLINTNNYGLSKMHNIIYLFVCLVHVEYKVLTILHDNQKKLTFRAPKVHLSFRVSTACAISSHGLVISSRYAKDTSSVISAFSSVRIKHQISYREKSAKYEKQYKHLIATTVRNYTTTPVVFIHLKT